MTSFGARLRRQRESHNKTLEEIARATKIHPSYLEALERDNFDELPGRAFGKFYIRAYADVLGFDPRTLLADYDSQAPPRETDEPTTAPPEAPRHPWKETLQQVRAEAQRSRLESLERAEAPPTRTAPEPEAEPVEPAAPAPTEEMSLVPTPAPRSPRRSLGFSIVLGVAVVGIGAWLLFEPLSAPPTDTASSSGEATTGSVRETHTPTAEPEAAPPPQAAADVTAAEPVTNAAPVPGQLKIAEFGVGRRIVNLRLEDRDDRFAEGTVVWFWTRVLGGEPGQRIRHVWFRESGRVQTVDLELGGSHWRTQSKKTVWGPGRWTVEARDAGGRVLARTTFTCVAAGS